MGSSGDGRGVGGSGGVQLLGRGGVVVPRCAIPQAAKTRATG